MTLFLISILSTITLLVGFLGLLTEPLKKRQVFLLFLFIYLISNYFYPNSGQWRTFIIVLGSALFIAFSSKKPLLYATLTFSGYLINVTINHILITLSGLCGYSIEDISTTYPLLFLLLQITLTFFVLTGIRKTLFPHFLFTGKPSSHTLHVFLFIELFLGVCSIIINIIYGEILGYPLNVLIFNAVLIGFYLLMNLIIFFNLYKFLKRDYELSAKVKETETMINYMEHMEHLYEEVRSFRHDYTNILCSMRDYIDSGNMEQLHIYFNQKIVPNSQILDTNDFLIGMVSNVKIPELKSILYTKLIYALSQSIHIKLEIKDHITSVGMDYLDLSRILGIFIDNAIEAASLTTEKELHIALIDTSNAHIFYISNSTLPINVPINELNKKGKTFKDNHDGLGLYNVRKIINPLSHVYLRSSCKEYFTQELTIQKQEA
ncbi:GHKL domain-containing protein [Lachnospiraceae bacterium OttesenSCG-928-D06]|nr:GHKL domain-containing protein [Lachnospiraceae bacterium OttesenSCG-928-D06]